MKGTTFMEKCKGIALIMGAFSLMLFGAAALIHSANPAQASEGPQMTSSTGKYQMALSTVMGDNRLNWYILVWNTETGRSKFYYGNAKGGTVAAHSSYSLPSSPL